MSFIPNNILLSSDNNTYLFTGNINNKLENIVFTSNIKSEDILENLRNINFCEFKKFPKEKNKDLENLHFIPMCYVFNFLVFLNIYKGNKYPIPTYLEFCNFFFSSYCEEINNKVHFKEKYGNSKVYFTKEELYARLGRTYPSFCREFYVKTVLNELREQYLDFNINIIYDLNLDLNGVDILVNIDKKDFGIAISDYTNRAEFYKNIKMKTRHNYEDDNLILEDKTLKMFTLKTDVLKTNKDEIKLPSKIKIEQLLKEMIIELYPYLKSC